MEHKQRETVVALMESIVARAHATPRHQHSGLAGGFLCVQDWRKSRLEFVLPIGMMRDKDAGLFAWHAQNRAQIMQDRPPQDLSLGGSHLGTIRTHRLILSFYGSLSHHLSEACVIALALHSRPRLLRPKDAARIMEGSKNTVFLGQFLNITRPESRG